ncbi:astacin-like metalloprotease toxin 5 [Galendromus occidentalis]|uniref:Metalloendopeptidase n=1 Tax=Galendromus occidentalis TaxID=34638 RepID=A0AAJ6QUX1_9ACAR|nr:astacin-like metalloprotease toxin 5 [Galendromus occidentalis]
MRTQGLVLLMAASLFSAAAYDVDEILKNSAMENEQLFEGDILSLGKNAMTASWKRWPNGVVPYVIDATAEADSKILRQAMEDYHENTCIRFVPRTNENDYIRIFKGQGCYSMVGRQGGQQPVSIGRGCAYVGTIIHEYGHAIGFYHEHTRSDRDEHIDIFLQNVDPTYHSQFTKLRSWQNRLYNNFDYDSVMLYGSKSFSRVRGKPSMSKKNGEAIEEVYNRKGMSQSDIERVNKLYGCSPKKNKSESKKMR